MEKTDFAVEKENAKIIAEFYYSLALLQSKAIGYIAGGETPPAKIDRLKYITDLVKTTGVKIDYSNPCSDRTNEDYVDCPIPPCRWDEVLCMCMYT